MLASLIVVLLAGAAGAATVQVRFWSQGRLLLADRAVPDGMAPEEAAVRALVAGPTEAEIGQGISTAIPSGVSIIGLSIAGDSAVIDLSQDVIAGLDESLLDAIFSQFRTTLGDFPSIMSIKLTSDEKPLSSYLAPAPEVSVPQAQPPAPIVGASGLSGKKIAVGPSHGRFWNGSGWYWQRSDPCGLGEAVLEDTNSIRLVQFLKQYLTQDGATFICPRQLDESHCCNGYEGQPWWKMAAYSWLRANGLPTSVWASASGVGGEETATGRNSDDIRARPLYADYMGADIYIAHHTNAGGGGTANGTETFRDTEMQYPAHEANSLTLATQIQNSVIDTIRSTYDGESAWANRGVKDSAGGFGEIRIPNRPAVLIELAFHDNCSRDASYLTDDFFRSVSEWAVYKGVCGYFGVSPTWDKYSCEYVSDTIPTTMVPGQSYNVSVTLRNRGVCWLNARNFRLGAVNDNNPFGAFTRVNLSGTIRPGSTYTFNFTLTAPAQGGTFTAAWRMVREGYAWFGPTISKSVDCGPNTDFTPPSVPTNVRSAGSTPSSITVAWDASTDNYGVVGYRIYRNGAQVGTSFGTSFTDTGLNYSTSYSYQVDAYDVVPNYSAKSSPVSLSTPAPPYYTWVQSSSNQDAYIRSGSPDAANPSSAIQVGWSSTGTIAIRRGLVAWDMTGAPAQSAVVNAANSVRVKLYCYTRSVNTAYGINLARITSNWTEAGATWNNMNANYSTVLASASVGAVGDYTWSWNGRTAGLPEQNRGLMVIHQQETVNTAAKIFTDREQYGGANPRPRIEIDYYDIVAPVNCSISIENGAAYATDLSVSLVLSASDFPSGMSQMQFSNDGVTWSAPEPYGTVKAGWTLSAGDGPKTVYVRYRDISGNWSAPVSDTVTLDTSAPTGTVSIEGGAEYTSSTSVVLTLSSADAAEMRLQNDGGAWTAWEAYAVTRSWALPAGDGAKTVCVEFRDAAGNVSLGEISDAITLDTTGPAASVADEGLYTPSTSELKAAISASDAESGVASYQYAVGTTAGGTDVVGWTGSSSAEITAGGLSLSPGVTYYISARAQNGASVWSDAADSDGIEVVAPTGTVAQAKALDSAGDKKVALLGKFVTARFADCLYIQEPRDGVSTGYSGIRVDLGGYVGSDWVNVAGVIGSTADGERVILSPTVKDGVAGASPRPVLILNRSVGGEALNAYTPGFAGLYGANNVGLLMAVAGILAKTPGGYWFVDDGSGVQYDPGYAGIPVDASVLSVMKQDGLQTGDYVVATGICQAGSVSGGSVPVLKLRQDSDLVSYR